MEDLKKRISELEKENNKYSEEREELLNRISELEDQVEDLTLQLKKHNSNKVPSQISISANHYPSAAQDDEPWLFYTAPGRTTQELMSVLDFSDVFELQAPDLLSEEAVWIKLLQKMHGDDLPVNLPALRKLASAQLYSACHHELMLVVRNIPGASHSLFQHILPHVATLTEFVNNAWTEIENNNPELLGRIAVVLECEQEIKVLSVDRDDTRMSLFVEAL